MHQFSIVLYRTWDLFDWLLRPRPTAVRHEAHRRLQLIAAFCFIHLGWLVCLLIALPERYNVAVALVSAALHIGIYIALKTGFYRIGSDIFIGYHILLLLVNPALFGVLGVLFSLLSLLKISLFLSKSYFLAVWLLLIGLYHLLLIAEFWNPQLHYVDMRGLGFFMTYGFFIILLITGVYQEDEAQLRRETEQLRATQSKKEALLRSIPGCVMMYNAEMILEFVQNDNKLPWDPSPLIGQHIKRVVDGPTWQKIRLDLARVLQKGHTVRFEMPLHTSVRRLWLDNWVTPIMCGQTVAGFLILSFDATDNRQLRDKIDERENWYRMLFEQSSDAIFITSEATKKIVEVNQQAANLLGYPIEKLQELTLGDLLVVDSASASDTKPIEPQMTVHQRYMQHSSGKRIPVVMGAAKIHDEQGNAYTSLLVRDIEALVQAQQALQESYEREREERTMAESMRDIIVRINRSLELEDVLETILNNLNRVIPHHTASIILREGDELRVVRLKGFDDRNLPIALRILKSGDLPLMQQMMTHKTPILLPDVSQSEDWVQITQEGVEGPRAYLGAPILHQNDVIGFINLDAYPPLEFADSDKARLEVFAAQAGLAIHNANIYRQARDMAAAEERQRLARELHDSVTQTLFSAALRAESLLLMRGSQPEALWDGLEELENLTRGSLAEMRTLLLELRPHALLNTELSVLIQRLVTGLQTRTTAQITVELHPCPQQLPSDVHINLYRIVQEALNNVIKHAQATQVRVMLQCAPGFVFAMVNDDGVGFDPDNLQTQNIGLRSMRERAAEHHIDLEIESTVGTGTVISAAWTDGEADV